MTDAPPAEPIHDSPPPEAAKPAPAPERRKMPRWKIVLVAAAAMLLVAGLVLRVTADPAPAPGAPGATPGAGSALVDGRTGGGAGTGAAAADDSLAWSKGLMALGFSFFVGFAVGTAVRAFVKLALVFAGLLFLVLAGLSHLELVVVNWEAMDELFGGFAERVGRDFEALRTMVTGRLPQAGLGALGLFAGFKRR